MIRRILRLRLQIWVLGFVFGSLLARSGLGPAGTILVALAAVSALLLAVRSGKSVLLLLALGAAAVATGYLRQATEMNTLARGRKVPVEQPVRVRGRLTEAPERHPDRSVLWIEGEGLNLGAGWRPLAGRYRISLPEKLDGFSRGDRIAALVTFDQPRSYRNPGGFDYVSHLSRRGVARVGYCRSPRLVVRVSRGDSFLSLVDRGRERYVGWLGSTGTDGGALMAALLAGDQSGLPDPVRDDFNRTGVSHLLSVSGLHLAMAAMIFHFIFFRLWKSSPRLCELMAAQRAAAILCVAPVVGYALITGLRLPTQRALVMVLTLLAAVASDRQRRVGDALWLAAGISLVFWPAAMFEPSFQLSYLAVAGIIYLYPRLASAARKPKSPASRELDAMERALGLREPRRKLFARRAAVVLAVTVAAQWAVLPVQLSLFHRANPLCLGYNLVAVPYTGALLMPVGSAATLTHFVWPAAGSFLLMLGAWLAELLLRFVGWGAGSLPGSGLWPPLSAAGVVAWYLAGIGLAEAAVALRRGAWSWHLFSPSRKRALLVQPGLTDPPGRPPFARALAVVSLAFLALALGAMVWPPCRLPAGSVSAIDVGQGQSIVVRGSDGQVIMVDGGGSHDGRFDVGENVVAPCLLALGITRLEAVALSHGHPDHARGLAYVLENFPVGELWLAPGGGAYQDELRAVARARGVPVRELDEGIGRFEFRGIGLRVLHPPAGFKTDNENNRSLVIRLQDEQLSLLLTGDIERDVETRLVRRYGPRGEVASGALGSRVMIVPHHGSKTSSTREFILAVGAGTALVSAAGEDESGLPARSVLERYRALGVEVAATSEEGMVMAWDHPVRVGRVKP